MGWQGKLGVRVLIPLKFKSFTVFIGVFVVPIYVATTGYLVEVMTTEERGSAIVLSFSRRFLGSIA